MSQAADHLDTLAWTIRFAKLLADDSHRRPNGVGESARRGE